ncbi:ornithine carbamoyltransferase [Vulgatibacter incomptus]|uniref:Ornithine carbamoyltransferase n=1 Tax=Vulgatibacter incomptus TaxID=1391653 RepID=A0A0K1P8P1_9BACT|nr:ornithine carbamoyltransferase [Vulgatibacter incomptus]AKU89776.1 Ornithine carbamoyltransferase [Vulgatibacter incomptus]
MSKHTDAKQKRDFLSLDGWSKQELLGLLERARELKELRRLGERHQPLAGKSVGLVFEKASTRTRVSFSVGAFELGAQALDLPVAQTQLGRGEPIPDAARVLSRYVHGLVIRTFAHERLEEFARWSSVPVINGLTDLHHPCQILADVQTAMERLGAVEDLEVAWIGDGNNVAHSWIEAASILGFRLRLACPEGYGPDAAVLAAAQARAPGLVSCVGSPEEAARGANVLTTDVWASMGQEEEAKVRAAAFAGFKIDRQLLSLATSEAIVLHCLPAHRGEEIDEGVLEGPSSAVFDEAENRLHVQKALLELLVG